MADLKMAIDYVLAFFGLFVTTLFMLIFFSNRGRVQVDPEPLKPLPSVTLVIPAFNEQECIGETIESALGCDYPKSKMQLILVNDGSTDGTLRVMREYASRHKNVLVISKKQGGKGSAVNAAIKRAKGELFATLDADSVMEKDALRKMTGFFRDPTTAAVTAVMKAWKAQNALQQMQHIEYLQTVFSRRLLSFINSINVTPGPLSVFRRDIFTEVGGFDEKNVLEDQEMAMRIQAHQYKIAAAMQAIVYTAVPSTLPELLAQRVRWHRGGIRNVLKHYYLMSRKYGDFGVFVMPASVFSMILTFIVLALVGASLLQGNAFLQSGFTGALLGITPLHVLGALVVLASVLWVRTGISQLSGEKVGVTPILAYLFIYGPLISVFWVVTAVKEIKREKVGW